MHLLQQVASALDHAHRQGIVHRDLKPSNIMVDSEGNAFLTGINAFDELGKTALHHAVEHERFGVAEVLLAHGADVNAHHEASLGNTPLAQIAGRCSLRMARLLVDAGADPRIAGWMQLNALDRARTRKWGDGPQVYEVLVRASTRRRA